MGNYGMTTLPFQLIFQSSAWQNCVYIFGSSLQVSRTHREREREKQIQHNCVFMNSINEKWFI